MSVEHVSQQILNIRSVAVVAMDIYTSTTINPFQWEIFHYFEIKCKKGVISVATAKLARNFVNIKMVIIISMGWG